VLRFVDAIGTPFIMRVWRTPESATSPPATATGHRLRGFTHCAEHRRWRHEASCDCIKGAIIPSPAETTSIKNEANPEEYQLSCANGVAGSAKVHATNAAVAAAISHNGHFDSDSGNVLPAAFIFEANAIHTTNGVAPRKHQNGSQRPTWRLRADRYRQGSEGGDCAHIQGQHLGWDIRGERLQGGVGTAGRGNDWGCYRRRQSRGWGAISIPGWLSNCLSFVVPFMLRPPIFLGPPQFPCLTDDNSCRS
jgi:hypothetical protein